MKTEKCPLADCSGAPDGNEVRLGVVDTEGAPLKLRFSLEQIGSLAMTLPTLLERAIRARYRDNSLRYVYTLGDWTIEASSNPEVVILNLSSTDGSSASFGVTRWMIGELADAFDGRARPAATGIPRPN